MSFVVTIEDVAPAPRADGVAWERARFEQAPSRSGDWTVLETIAIFPLDVDPAEPAARSFTTTQATLDPGWFRITFLDPANAEQSSEPVYSAPIGTAYTSASAVRSALAPSGQQDAVGGTAASMSDHDLQQAIIEAASEINAALATRYSLPLPETPRIVESLNRDIAAYTATLTYRRNVPLDQRDPVALRYERAQRNLLQIATGKMQLAVSSGTEAAAPQATVVNPYEGDLFSEDDFGLGITPGRQRWQSGSADDMFA